MVKNLPAMQETWVQSLGQEDSPEERNGYPLQYSCLENSMDRGAWRATYCGISESVMTEWLTHMLWVVSEVAQSCPTLCDPMNCSLLGSSVHGIFLARVLEFVAMSFSRGSFQPRDRTQVSCIAGRHFTVWATGKLRISSQMTFPTY